MSDPQSDTFSSRLKPGDRVGRYRLLAPLASGGMAEVWAAKPEGRLGLSRTVAMKVVKAEYAADEEYTRMLIDEATVASSIHHPNVCDLLELDQHEDLIFMVMEWVAGDSLAGLLHQSTKLHPLKYHHAARIVADACGGTHAAHEACDPDGMPLGIVHRDISPPNILLSLQGQVKVSDFGIAKARHQLHSRTRTGEIKGKFAYIPTEQIVGDAVDRRADVYALGCVLYVATLGLRPFGSGPQAMNKILHGLYKRPREIKPNYPEGLEAVIVKALQQDRNDRYQTADDMRVALEEWLVDRDQVVTSDDLAALVRRRLSDDKRIAIEELRKLSRVATKEDLMRGLEIVEREQTPTAGSGLVSIPEDLLALRAGREDETLPNPGPPPPTSRTPAAESERTIRRRQAEADKPTIRPGARTKAAQESPAASTAAPIVVAPTRSLIPGRAGSKAIIALLACIILLLIVVVALLLGR